MSSHFPAFTLVTTTFNEIERLDDTISDIDNQSLLPSEVIVVDAGSTDGTVDRLNKWAESARFPVLIYEKKDCNIAEGRNYAIQEAKHQLIASTDFGCTYHQDWLKELITPFLENETKASCTSFTVPFSEVKTLAGRGNFILERGYEVSMNEYFVPSSRSIAYTKNVWQQAGKYPEWLTLAADDTLFYYALKSENIPIVYINKPLVYWGRHETFKAFGKESYRYGLGQGEARVSFRNFISMAIEYLVRNVAPFFILLAVINPYSLLIFFALAWLGYRPHRAAIKNFNYLRKKYKLSLNDLFAAFNLIYETRRQHINGYIKGYWNSNPKVKAKAEEFKAKYTTP